MNIRDKVKLALYTEKLMDAVSHKQPAKLIGLRPKPPQKKTR